MAGVFISLSDLFRHMLVYSLEHTIKLTYHLWKFSCTLFPKKLSTEIKIYVVIIDLRTQRQNGMYESLKEQINTFSFQQLKMVEQMTEKSSICHASWHSSSVIYSVVYHSKSDLVLHSSPWFILI
jgi:hypothetical protein